MNQVLRAAGANADHAWLMGLATAFFTALFVAYVIRMFTKRGRQEMSEAAKLPFEED
jgi:cbb3-type cytochrome oxidase subunit 3